MADRQAALHEFEVFFEAHHRDVARLAYLLTGDRAGADDLTADAFVAAWQRWETVRATEQPLAYVRRIVANLAASRIRRLIRERRGLGLLGATASDRAPTPDIPAITDVRAALQRIPARRRACVVLRHLLDLSEEETARTLGVSIGTVKSQTSRGLADLARLLADDATPERRPGYRPYTSNIALRNSEGGSR